MTDKPLVYVPAGCIAVEAPLWHHSHGRQQTRSGYGRKLSTIHMLQLPGEKVWRRVYCYIYSNSGTCYVIVNGEWQIVRGIHNGKTE